MILAIDTSTHASSVALLDESSGRVVSRSNGSGRHAEVLMPLIAEVLDESGTQTKELTRIVVGVGPGPFTGLRVGLMTARTMAHALSIPVVGVCSLDAIACEYALDADVEELVVLTPARRREFYSATYDAEGIRTAGPRVVRRDDLPRQGSLVGGADATVSPDARWLALLAVEALARGEEVFDADASAFEDSAESRGDSLAARIRGHVLLAPHALYLRRPDAVPPAAVTATTATGMAPRRMRWWDLDSVLEIERSVFPTTAWSAGTFWSELAVVPSTRHYVVTTDERGVTGYAGLAAHAPDAEVQTIAVATRAQGQGIGRILLDDLVAEARRRGCGRLMLEVRADNVAAIGLYESTGFEANGRRRDYYGQGIDALLMERRI